MSTRGTSPPLSSCHSSSPNGFQCIIRTSSRSYTWTHQSTGRDKYWVGGTKRRKDLHVRSRTVYPLRVTPTIKGKITRIQYLSSVLFEFTHYLVIRWKVEVVGSRISPVDHTVPTHFPFRKGRIDCVPFVRFRFRPK